MKNSDALKIAHRGYIQYHPDNSIAAFRSAIEMGFNMIELDIQLCRQNKIVIFHDCHISGIPVGYFTHEQIKLHHTTVMTIDEFFNEFTEYTNIKLLFDLKGCDELAGYLKTYLINNHIITENIYIGSFNINHIRILDGIGAKLGFITCNKFTITQYCDLFQTLHFVSVDKSILDQDVVNICHGLNKKLFVFTCNNLFDRHYINMFHVDGIISNIQL